VYRSCILFAHRLECGYCLDAAVELLTTDGECTVVDGGSKVSATRLAQKANYAKLLFDSLLFFPLYLILQREGSKRNSISILSKNSRLLGS
jgi:hypothetical protein